MKKRLKWQKLASPGFKRVKVGIDWRERTKMCLFVCFYQRCVLTGYIVFYGIGSLVRGALIKTTITFEPYFSCNFFNVIEMLRLVSRQEKQP